MRRNAEWRSKYYELFQQNQSRPQSFAEVLRALHAGTGRAEASFASKLVASIDPDMPVIDAFVLKNLGLRLPAASPIDRRLTRIADLHDRICDTYVAYLGTASGRHLMDRFVQAYPDRNITRVKMLDLMLWKAR